MNLWNLQNKWSSYNIKHKTYKKFIPYTVSMLINFFIDNPLQYKQIEKYQYTGLSLISLYVIYNIYYVTNLEDINNIMLFYLLIETFYLPFYKMDTIIHHVISMFFVVYPKLYFIPMEQIYHHNVTFLKVEMSSIFLCSSYFLKEQKKISNNKCISYSLHISNALFIGCFFKYRCYEFIYQLGLNPEFYQDMIIDNSISSEIYVYLTMSSFMALNCYWFYKIILVVFKK